MSQAIGQFRSLIERVRDGDEAAFKELYESLSGRVFSYIIPRVRSRDEALDVLQDVFVDLWSARLRISYVNDASVWGFVFTIARRKLAAHYEARRKDSAIAEIPQEDKYDMNLDAVDSIHTIERAMRDLSDKDRDIITLRYWNGLSFAEIAEIQGKAETAVRVHHHRAREKLKAILKRYGDQ